MAIQFACLCGAKYTVDDSQAGILHHCDACGLDIPVPAACAPGAADAAPPPLPAEVAPPPPAPANLELADLLPAAEVVEETPLKPSGRTGAAALAQGMGMGGKAGAADLVAQMKAARAGGAGGLVMSDFAAAGPVASGAKRPAPGRPLTAHQRASHHIGFKRIMWKPALGVGILCVLFGLGSVGICYMKAHQMSPGVPRELPPGIGGKITTDETGNRMFEDLRGEVKQRVFTDPQGEEWFIDPDATDVKFENGRLIGQVTGGYDVLGTKATDNQDYRATVHVTKVAERVEGASAKYLLFAAAFFLVGLSLMVLALWMRHDVRLVAGKADAGPEEGEAAPAVAAPVLPAAIPLAATAADAAPPLPAAADAGGNAGGAAAALAPAAGSSEGTPPTAALSAPEPPKAP